MRPLYLITAVTAALGLRFFWMTWKYAVNVIFSDQWDFLDPFFRGQPGIAKLFLWQHGPHREGIGLIADKLLYPATHWDARADSFQIGVCIFASALLALLLKRKLFGAFSYSDAAIPCMFLTLSQFETLVGEPNPACSGYPLLLMMLFCLALLQPNRFLRYGFALLLNALLVYTGYGFFFGPVTILVFLSECAWSRRQPEAGSVFAPLTGLAIAAATLGSFFIRYTFTTAVGCFGVPLRQSYFYPWFMAVMFSTYVGLKGHFVVTAIGALLLAAALFVAASSFVRGGGRVRARFLVCGALTAFSLLFALFAAVGRVCLGLPAAAQSSRYGTLMIPAYLGMYFYCLSAPWPKWWKVLPAACLVLVLPGLWAVPRTVALLAKQKAGWAECYKRIENVEQCDQEAGIKVFPEPARTGLRGKLDFLKQHRLNLFFTPSGR